MLLAEQADSELVLPQEALVQQQNTSNIFETNSTVGDAGDNGQQAIAQVLVTYGHNPSDDGVMLLVSDPSVVCFSTESHQAVMGLAIACILVVIVGLPAVLVLVVVPEIDRTVSSSPSAPWLASASRLLDAATTAQPASDTCFGLFSRSHTGPSPM